MAQNKKIRTKKSFLKKTRNLIRSQKNSLSEISDSIATKSSLNSDYNFSKKKKISKKQKSIQNTSELSRNIKYEEVKYIKNKKIITSKTFVCFKEEIIYKNHDFFDHFKKDKPEIDFDFESEEELIKSAVREARKNIQKCLDSADFKYI